MAALRSAARSLWRRVHPDLFQRHPAAAASNQRAMQDVGAFLDAAAERHHALLTGEPPPPPPPARSLAFFVDAPAPAEPREVCVRLAPPHVPRHLASAAAAERWADGVRRCIEDAVAALDGSPDVGAAGASEERSDAPPAAADPLLAAALRASAARQRHERRGAAAAAAPPPPPPPPPPRMRLETSRLFFGRGIDSDEQQRLIEALRRLLPQLSPRVVRALRGGGSSSSRSTHLRSKHLPPHPPIVVAAREGAGGAGGAGVGGAGIAHLDPSFQLADLEAALLEAARPPSAAGGESGARGGSGGRADGGGRGVAEAAVDAARRLRAAVRCDGVLTSGADAETALLVAEALLAQATELREALDLSWQGVRLRLLPAAEEGAANCRLTDGAGGGAQLLVRGTQGAAEVLALVRREAHSLRRARERVAASPLPGRRRRGWPRPSAPTPRGPTGGAARRAVRAARLRRRHRHWHRPRLRGRAGGVVAPAALRGAGGRACARRQVRTCEATPGDWQRRRGGGGARHGRPTRRNGGVCCTTVRLWRR